MILKGYIGTVYVRADRDSRIDLWRSDVRLKQDDVVREMLENNLEIVSQLAANSEVYNGYDIESENAADNKDYLDVFDRMLEDVRAKLDGGYFNDSYEDVEINISPLNVHIPQLTEYEWAGICGSTAI